jgi:hypothetical protein
MSLKRYLEKKLEEKTNLAKNRITVEVIADSISPDNKRITTLRVTYPRFITPEVLTHRSLSRNSSSSRAIPSKILRKKVWNTPSLPVEWGANNKGMQSHSLLPAIKGLACYYLWILASKFACIISFLFEKIGLHKQIANRVTEFAQPVTLVITATEWANFFALRYHPDAQPEFKFLAMLMYNALHYSIPNHLGYGEWHLPFITSYEKEIALAAGTNLVKVSVARCARTSYYTQDGEISSVGADTELYNRLVNNDPGHLSPTEHQALCVKNPESHLTGNFKGWIQYRKLLHNECIKEFGAITDN